MMLAHEELLEKKNDEIALLKAELNAEHHKAFKICIFVTQDFCHLAQQHGETVTNFIHCLESVFRRASGREKFSVEKRDALSYGKLQEGLKYDPLKSPAVSEAHTYQELCISARNQGREPKCVPCFGIVDSGADISIMGSKLFKQVTAVARLHKRDFQRPDKTPRGYDRKPFHIDSKVNLDICFQDKVMNTPVYVKMDAPEQLLLLEVFQKFMQRVISDLNPPEGPDFMGVYVDDLLISSCSFEEHLDHLSRVTSRLRSANLKLKLTKCQFVRPRVENLVVTTHTPFSVQFQLPKLDLRDSSLRTSSSPLHGRRRAFESTARPVAPATTATITASDMKRVGGSKAPTTAVTFVADKPRTTAHLLTGGGSGGDVTLDPPELSTLSLSPGFSGLGSPSTPPQAHLTAVFDMTANTALRTRPFPPIGDTPGRHGPSTWSTAYPSFKDQRKTQPLTMGPTPATVAVSVPLPVVSSLAGSVEFVASSCAPQGSRTVSGTPLVPATVSSSLVGTPLLPATGSSSLAGTPLMPATVSSSLAGTPLVPATVSSSLAGTPLMPATGSSSLAGTPLVPATVSSSLAGTPLVPATVSSSLAGTPLMPATVSSSLAGTPLVPATGSSSLAGTPLVPATVSSSLAGTPLVPATVSSSLVTGTQPGTSAHSGAKGSDERKAVPAEGNPGTNRYSTLVIGRTHCPTCGHTLIFCGAATFVLCSAQSSLPARPVSGSSTSDTSLTGPHLYSSTSAGIVAGFRTMGTTSVTASFNVFSPLNSPSHSPLASPTPGDSLTTSPATLVSATPGGPRPKAVPSPSSSLSKSSEKRVLEPSPRSDADGRKKASEAGLLTPRTSLERKERTESYGAPSPGSWGSGVSPPSVRPNDNKGKRVQDEEATSRGSLHSASPRGTEERTRGTEERARGAEERGRGTEERAGGAEERVSSSRLHSLVTTAPSGHSQTSVLPLFSHVHVSSHLSPHSSATLGSTVPQTTAVSTMQGSLSFSSVRGSLFAKGSLSSAAAAQSPSVSLASQSPLFSAQSHPTLPMSASLPAILFASPRPSLTTPSLVKPRTSLTTPSTVTPHPSLTTPSLATQRPLLTTPSSVLPQPPLTTPSPHLPLTTPSSVTPHSSPAMALFTPPSSLTTPSSARSILATQTSPISSPLPPTYRVPKICPLPAEYPHIRSGKLSIVHSKDTRQPHESTHTQPVQERAVCSVSLHPLPLLPLLCGVVVDVKGSVRDLCPVVCPEVVTFDPTCCVGGALTTQVVLNNEGDRWMQSSLELTALRKDGVECLADEKCKVFALQPRCFIGPHKSEIVKITFRPFLPGTYRGELTVTSRLVVEDASSTVLTRGQGPPLLDYGLVLAGTSSSLPLRLINHGHADISLGLVISAAPTLTQTCLSFGDGSKSLPAQLHPSASSSCTSLYITLPPKKDMPEMLCTLIMHHKTFAVVCRRRMIVILSIVTFKAPKKHYQELEATGPLEEISAHVDCMIDGVGTGPLFSVPIKATVGVARLHVPRSLMTLSLSCLAGSTVTRAVPLKNAGNVPILVKLKTSEKAAHFSVYPEVLHLEVNQEAQVSVQFAPPTGLTTNEGLLMMYIDPSGPNYEMKLHGTAVESQSAEKCLLSCNKSSLYWGGVNVGDSRPLKLVIRNSFPYEVPLRVSLRDPLSAFQLHDLPDQDITIHPEEQLPLHVVFAPSVAKVFVNALDIYDQMHSKKFKIPLCGYGGTSDVELVNIPKSSGGYLLDLGQDRELHCEGAMLPRYVQFGESSSPLPPSQVAVSPAEFILPPQASKELVVIFTGEPKPSAPPGSPLAQLVFFTGDEIVRERFVRAMSKGLQLGNLFNKMFVKQLPEQKSITAEMELSNFEVDNEEKFFESHLQTITVLLVGCVQDSIPSLPSQPHSTIAPTTSLSSWTIPRDQPTLRDEPRSGVGTNKEWSVEPKSLLLSPVDGGDVTTAFCMYFAHIEVPHKHELMIHNHSGSPLRYRVVWPNSHLTVAPDQGIIKPRNSSHVFVGTNVSASSLVQPWTGSITVHCGIEKQVVHVQVLQGTPRWSLTMAANTPTSLHSSPACDPNFLTVVSSRSVAFHDTCVGQCSEKFLELHNPFQQPMDWRLSSAASSFHRDTSGGATDICKVSYAVFWIRDMVGTILPQRDTKVLAMFQPREVGSFSQVWDLDAIPASVSQEPHSTAQSALNTAQVKKPAKSGNRMSVYLDTNGVEFPLTRPGERVVVKVRVVNKSSDLKVGTYYSDSNFLKTLYQQFQVIKPQLPFSVEHLHFDLGHRMCARLPIYFCPTQGGQDYEGILAIRTNEGHQMFTTLKGKSTPSQ
eukprot:Em0018g261a